MKETKPISRKPGGSPKSGLADDGAPIEMSRMRSFGEAMPDLHFELVADPEKSGGLRMHVHKGSRFSTTSEVQHGRYVYFPAPIGEGLAQAVRFPPPSAHFGSPSKLTESIAKFICDFGKTPREDADLLAAFAISTWFVDCFARAPLLHLTGSYMRVHSIMRLLACVCRRPILLGRLDLAALSTLPEGLEATLLIHEEKLPRSLTRILDTSRYRDIKIPLKKSWIHAYGARVLFSDPMALDAAALRIDLSSVGGMPELKDDVERTIAADFQAKLLRYRMVQYDAVKGSHFNSSDFVPQMQEVVRALITPLIDCGEFRESILSSLTSRNKDCAGARFTDLNCLVIEAALAFCHDSIKEAFFVKDIADAADAILEGRHEDSKISPKAAGQTLRGLGLFPERVTNGYQLTLSDVHREKIHGLAQEYNVPSLDEGTRRCDYCPPSVLELKGRRCIS